MAELQNVFGTPQVQQINPLQAMGAVQGLQVQQQQLQNLQAEGALLNNRVAAQQGLADIYQSVPVDPQTGSPDYKVLMGKIMSDPRTAPLAPELMTAIAGSDRSVQDAATAGINAAQAHFSAISQATQPVLYAATRPGATMDDIKKAAMQAHQGLVEGSNPVLKQGEADPILQAINNAQTPQEASAILRQITARGKQFDDSFKIMNGTGDQTNQEFLQSAGDAQNMNTYRVGLGQDIAQSQNAKKFLGDITPLAQQLAKNGATGAGAETRLQVANFLKAIGVGDQEVSRILGQGGANMTNLQLLNMMTEKLKLAAPNLLGVAKNEFQNQQFANALPTSTNDPKAALQVLGLVNSFANRKINEGLLLNQYEHEHGTQGFRGWNGQLQKYWTNNAKVLDMEPTQLQDKLNNFGK